MPKIVAIEGVRGVGKSTVIKQLDEKYYIKNRNDIHIRKFPSESLVDKIQWMPYNMDDIDDVIAYQMHFVNEFIQFSESVKKFNDLFIVDRYILSNLAQSMYQIYRIKKDNHIWDGIERMLYYFYNNTWVQKPDLIIYLKGSHKQPAPKFDDEKFKEVVVGDELEWYYNRQLANLKNKLQIPFEMVTSHRDDTFTHVEYILKSRGLLN